MKIKFLATGNAPTHYLIAGDVITAFHDGQDEDFDLSGLQEDDQFQGVAVDDLSLSPGHVVRAAERDSNGELHVTLCQQVGPGHWKESDWMDVSAYNPAGIHASYDNTKAHSGDPWATTSEGKQWVKQ